MQKFLLLLILIHMEFHEFQVKQCVGIILKTEVIFLEGRFLLHLCRFVIVAVIYIVVVHEKAC